MTVKLKKKKLFFFLLIVTYGLRAITDALFVSREISSAWTAMKYATLLLAVAYGFCCLCHSGHRWKYLYLLQNISIVVFTFILISSFRMIYTGVFSSAVFKLAVHMLLPAIASVIALNLADSDDIYNCFSWILCVALFIYCVFEIGVQMFSWVNIATISFNNSLSPFESHYTSATAMALSAYFSFDRRKKSVTFLSLIFSLLTFKRVFVVSSIVLFFLPMFIDVHRRVSIQMHRLCAMGICAVAVAYYWCLIPENHAFLERFLGIESVYEFTSSRSGFFEKIYSNPFFVNFGWGACEAALGRLLEMDMIQMLIEVSVIGVAVFVFMYWRITGTTIYGMVYMGFHFINMLTSHCLENAFVWIIILVSLAQVDGNVKQNKKKRWKFVIGV